MPTYLPVSLEVLNGFREDHQRTRKDLIEFFTHCEQAVAHIDFEKLEGPKGNLI